MPKWHVGGRSKATEWNEVTVTSSSDQQNKVNCNYCQESITKKIERVKHHLEKCPQRRKAYAEAEAIPSVSPLPSTSSISSTRSLCETDDNLSDISILTSSFGHSTPIKPKKQKSMSSYVAKTTLEKKDELDLQVARFVFSSNIPFNVLENKEFKKLINMLRPGYESPTRKKVSSDLLVKVNEEVIESMKSELEDECTTAITLIQDGWSTVSNDPIIAHSIHNGKKPYLISATDAGSHKKTAEYCAQLAKEAIMNTKDNYNKDVFAICTDNENKMLKMREILTKEYPKLIAYGCSAHFLNLVEKDVTPKSILKYIIEINKYFRNHHQPHGWLMDKGGLMPQLPNDTRWNSQLDCIKTYLSNCSLYIDIRGEHMDTIDDNVGKLIDNLAIQREAINLQTQLELVGCALDKLQADNTTLSDSVEIWLDIINDEKLSPYKDDIMSRFKKAMEPFHFLANLTNPKYEGKKLNRDQEEQAEEWLNEIYPEFMPGYVAYRLKNTSCIPSYLFNDNIINSTTAQDWWKIIELKEAKTSNLPPNFPRFIRSLQSCPASSGSIERIFSTYGLVWSKMRNRLGCEKAEMLVRIYRYLRLK